MEEKRNKGGRPRKWALGESQRTFTRMENRMVATVTILAEYLDAHSDNGADFGSVVRSAIGEYLTTHATLVELAVEWYRKQEKGGAKHGGTSKQTQGKR